MVFGWLVNCIYLRTCCVLRVDRPFGQCVQALLSIGEWGCRKEDQHALSLDVRKGVVLYIYIYIFFFYKLNDCFYLDFCTQISGSSFAVLFQVTKVVYPWESFHVPAGAVTAYATALWF